LKNSVFVPNQGDCKSSSGGVLGRPRASALRPPCVLARLDVASDAAAKSVTVGGVGLVATCASGNTKLETHNASAQSAAIEAGIISDQGGPPSAHQFNDEAFTSDDADDVAQGGSGTGMAVVVFVDGAVTTIDYGFQDALQTSSGCRFFGRAISG
jgi:hypothetical protein